MYSSVLFFYFNFICLKFLTLEIVPKQPFRKSAYRFIFSSLTSIDKEKLPEEEILRGTRCKTEPILSWVTPGSRIINHYSYEKCKGKVSCVCKGCSTVSVHCPGKITFWRKGESWAYVLQNLRYLWATMHSSRKQAKSSEHFKESEIERQDESGRSAGWEEQ